ncbi:MAG: S1 RNA-binding domain-containing protein [Holosporaceae bacterium]
MLGVKQLSEDPAAEARSAFKKGDVVTCEITALQDAGLDVAFANGALKGFIKKVDLSRDRAEQRANRFAVGEKVDAKIMTLDASRVSLSIKARELEEERDIMQKYGSSDSGATLGEMLGLSLDKATKGKDAKESTDKNVKAAKVSKPATSAEDASKATEVKKEKADTTDKA